MVRSTSQVSLGFAFSIVASLLTACGQSSSTSPTPETGLSALSVECGDAEKASATGPWLDPSLQPAECQGIRKVYHGIESAQLTAPSASNFERIFGGLSSDSVIQYLNARVHYIVPNSAVFNGHTRGQVIPITSGSAQTVAVNMGMAFWLAKKRMPSSPDLTFSLGTTPLETSSPSSGIIYLGRNFSEYHLIQKMETLVHEARHSDCDDPNSALCGLPHAACPAGHEFSGQTACDNAGIGPYFVGAVYSKAMAETCANCSERERQISLLVATDSIGRVLNLSDIQSGKETTFRSQNVVNGSPESHREALARIRNTRKTELGK